LRVALDPQEKAVAYFVREPFPSVSTGTLLRGGKLAHRGVEITSRMNDGGAIFADGMEQDRIAFDWGRRLTVAPAEQVLRLASG
jgi:hypothetical protein